MCFRSTPQFAIKIDGQGEPERARKISASHIEQPVISFQHARIADQEDGRGPEYLQRQQQPVIAPRLYRLAEAEIEQKAIEHYVKLAVAGREAVERDAVGNADDV